MYFVNTDRCTNRQTDRQAVYHYTPKNICFEGGIISNNGISSDNKVFFLHSEYMYTDGINPIPHMIIPVLRIKKKCLTVFSFPIIFFIPLTLYQTTELSKLRAFADDKIKGDPNGKICPG